MNPVAVGQDEDWQQAYPQRMPPMNVVVFPGSEGNISQGHAAIAQATSFSSSSTSATSNQPQSLPNSCSPITNAASVPTDNCGFAENPDAYKVWQPKPVEGETVTPGQLKAKLAELSHNLSMPQPQKPEREPKDERSELNQWLADPILRAEVITRVMRSDYFTVEFDEQGQPIQVMEMAL